VCHRGKVRKAWLTPLCKYKDQFVGRIEQHVDTEQRDWLIKMPQDIEESLRLANLCLEKSLESIPISANCTTGNERKSLLKRLANVKNELGAFYMNQVSQNRPFSPWYNSSMNYFFKGLLIGTSIVG
jgi:hypothetical protein